MLRGRFPFRLGTTSYIIPADIVPNVQALAGVVDDVELVLFEAEDVSNLPNAATLDALRWLAVRHDLTYTVHLPLDLALGDADEAMRRAAVDKCSVIIASTSVLKPEGFILHFHHPAYRTGIPPGDVPRWQAALRQSVGELLPTGVTPSLLCVENLSYPFEWVAPIVAEYGLSICLDVGHLLLTGQDVGAHMDRYGDRTRVMHLHGIVDNKDHRDISSLDRGLLRMLLSRWSAPGSPGRVLTLEVFGAGDLATSLAVLNEMTS